MSFEHDENAKLDNHSVNHSGASAANLSPGVSVPSNLSNSTYESENTNMAEKIEAMHNMIQKIMTLFNKPRPSKDDSQQHEPATRRTK
jgi:hypothetical protein